MFCNSQNQSTRLPTPREMIAHLDRFVLGQERVKRDLATAIYNHYIGASYAETPDAEHRDLERQHILLLGSTGSGKTFIVRTLADYLGVPLCVASATSFSEAGYVGDKVESLILNLVSIANGDVAKAERGIIFIDEIDKIKKGGQGVGRDVSGEGVQAALLTLLDGRTITIRTGGGEPTHIDVSKILFVCAGAFVGLTDIIRERLKTEQGGNLGFASAIARGDGDAAELCEDDLIERCETADIESYGMIPELIGRLATIAATRQLGRENLMRMLTEVEGSPIAKAKTLFALHGIDLEFEHAALDEIAGRALRLRTGARGLKRAVLGALAAVDYRLPELAADGVTRITVTKETVAQGHEPRMQRGARDDARGNETEADRLRQIALLPAACRRAVPDAQGPLAHGISDTRRWSAARLRDRLETLKRDRLDWPNTTGSARKWWSAFEDESKDRLWVVVRLAEELAIRKATITEFFLSYVYSNTDNIQANLHYLDFTRLKKAEEAKRAKERKEPPGTAGDPENVGGDDESI